MKTRLFFCLILAPLVAACAPKERAAQGAVGSAVAVFVPGVVSGSPTYEMLVAGVERAAGKTAVTVIEGGYNQAEWEGKLTSLAASKKYALIVSSNPSLPSLVKSVNRKFPEQRFLLFDGEISGLPAVYSLRYRSEEEAYLAGYFAALLSRERDASCTRVGLVAAQEYPVMNEQILPWYRRGAAAVDPAFTVDFRVIGNWFDAEKAASLAAQIYRDGAQVCLTIAGGANEGVAQAAREAGGKVVWFDSDGAPGREDVVAGSAVILAEEVISGKIRAWLDGTLPWGTAEAAGVAEGCVEFISGADVSAAIREKLTALRESLAEAEGGGSPDA